MAWIPAEDGRRSGVNAPRRAFHVVCSTICLTTHFAGCNGVATAQLKILVISRMV